MWAQIGLGMLLDESSAPKTGKQLGFDPSFVFDLKTNILKRTILTELGRLRDEQGDAVAMQAAKVVCENRMRARAAVAWIRRLRGKANQPNAGSLITRLAKTINDYLAEHPEATWDDVQRSLVLMSAVVRESANS